MSPPGDTQKSKSWSLHSDSYSLDMNSVIADLNLTGEGPL